MCEKQVGKSQSEMSCLPEISKTLNLKGYAITIDAAGVYKHLIDKIREKSAHYVISLKANQPKAYKAAQTHFETLENQIDYLLSSGFDESHGRLIRRRYLAFPCHRITELKDFSGIKSIVAVETISSFDKDVSRKVTAHWRYLISSHKHT